MSRRQTRPVSIEGTITCADGETVKFSITGDGGWQQWGNVPDVLYRTSPLMDALGPAAAEFLPSDYETEPEDFEDPADLRRHLTEVHGLPEEDRQDMSDPECIDYHEEAHTN